MSTPIEQLLKRHSFIERNARSRARALLDAGGNRLLGSLGRAVEIALEHSFVISTQTAGAVEASLPGHRAVVRAVEARDPAAAAAAGAHSEIGMLIPVITPSSRPAVVAEKPASR